MRSSAQQEGDLHGYGVGRAVDLASQAVPALVELHVGLAAHGADREAIDRARVDADVAAGDAAARVDDDRGVGALRRLRVAHAAGLGRLHRLALGPRGEGLGGIHDGSSGTTVGRATLADGALAPGTASGAPLAPVS